MGPRRWSRGRASAVTFHRRQPRCFNGATAMEPWKSGSTNNDETDSFALQWGHGDGAVEEGGHAGVGSLGASRFNGATAMEPWKRSVSMVCRIRSPQLQWGHGDGAVEELCNSAGRSRSF